MEYVEFVDAPLNQRCASTKIKRLAYIVMAYIVMAYTVMAPAKVERLVFSGLVERPRRWESVMPQNGDIAPRTDATEARSQAGTLRSKACALHIGPASRYPNAGTPNGLGVESAFDCFDDSHELRSLSSQHLRPDKSA